MSAAALLAHGGGWDEAAFIALPVAIFGGLLMVANKRAAAAEREEGAEYPHDPKVSADATDRDDEAKPDAPSEEPPS